MAQPVGDPLARGPSTRATSIWAPFTAGDVLAQVGGRLEPAQADLPLTRMAPLGSAQPGELSFFAAARHRRDAQITRASLVIVSELLAPALPQACARLIVGDPYACYAAISRWLESQAGTNAASPGVHPSAVIAPDAQVHPTASIGAGCVLESGSSVGAGSQLGAHVVIGAGSRIGDNTVLHPRVVVYHDCSVGDRCVVHAGTVIGSDGFGFARQGAAWSKIAQLGRALVGDDVEIGANCTIDRGAIDDTVIGNGCKLDNLIQVGHNVQIGEHTAIAGCVGIAGSAVIGSRCMIGGGAGILGHLSVCDDAVISAMSLVTRSINRPGLHTGVFPLMPNADWERAAVALKQLPALRTRVRQLEQRFTDRSNASPSALPSASDDNKDPT
jgi:UDP-3-O-[3-hydroxymyristoyl] glucosamine N-acyltransferase